ncbi:MAG: hypothetical protein AVDCRST_MAG04-2291, partial [uncultured Acetobacteraceae bacterium]
GAHHHPARGDRPRRGRAGCGGRRRRGAAHPGRERGDAAPPHRERRRAARHPPDALRRARRGHLPREHGQVRAGDRRAGPRGFRGLGGHPRPDRRDRQHRRGPGCGDRLGRRPARLRRQARRGLRHRRVPRQEVRRLDVPRREVRQAGALQQLDRHPARRLDGSGRLPRFGGEGGGFRHHSAGPRGLPPPLPGAKAPEQTGGLHPRQRGGGRQRHGQLAHLVARRLPGGRGRQGRHQQPRDHRVAELPKGTLPHLRARHAVLARPVEQPRLRLAGVLADAQRRVAVFRPEERPGDARHRRGHGPRAEAARPRQRPAGRRHRAERHGVPAHALPERGEAVHHLFDGGRAVRSVADRLPRLLVAPAQGLRRERSVGFGPQAQGVPGRHEQSVLERLQGADHPGFGHRLGGVRHGADVRLRRLRPSHAGGRRARGGAPRPTLLPL